MYNSNKFKNLLLYFCKKSESDIHFGSVKLNKLFYYADFWAYAVLGKPITGANYIHKRRGPVPSPMGSILMNLQKSGDIRMEHLPRWMGQEQKRTIAHTDPDMSEFTEDEIKICEEQLRLFVGKTAEQLSDESHNWFGWLYTDENEEIPYHSIYVRKTEPVSVADFKWAVSVLDSMGR